MVLARSLNRSLRRLREGALAVANRDLPDAVAAAAGRRQTSATAGSTRSSAQVRDPIRLDTRDEIGQVAEAFNAVHREAVRVAAEQAALRTSVSAMFLNLARRSQTLVDRLIGELDRDRARRGGPEAAGRALPARPPGHPDAPQRREPAGPGRRRLQPRRAASDALLVDVLRAAQSEVEHYTRIEFGTIDRDISVAAHAVNDVVRLVAELFDNATRVLAAGLQPWSSRPAGSATTCCSRSRTAGLGMTDGAAATRSTSGWPSRRAWTWPCSG